MMASVLAELNELKEDRFDSNNLDRRLFKCSSSNSASLNYYMYHSKFISRRIGRKKKKQDMNTAEGCVEEVKQKFTSKLSM